MWTGSSTLIGDPGLDIPYAESDKPERAKLRENSDGPEVAGSSTTIGDSKRTQENTGNAEPNQLAPLVDELGPGVKESGANNSAPNLVMP